jgi:hypothetical protein
MKMNFSKKFSFGIIFCAALLLFCFAAYSADTGAFSLKGGRVHKGGAELDCEVNEVPRGTEGPVRYWSAFGESAGGSVTEDETGVRFFSQDGACLMFVPLESEYECQNVSFSPGGGGKNFVIESGSQMRPDITYKVYGGDAEQTAEFDGIRGEFAWIDQVRFVMTRIDDTRDGDDGVFIRHRGGLRVSVVMYDTAAGEAVVLKEATDTRNFWFVEVIGDGNAVTVTEGSVKSEKDWADEEKIETREIRVEIPAAG